MVSLKNNPTKKFLILGLLMELVYLSFYFIEPLRNYLGDPGITLRNPLLFLLIVILLLINLLLYIMACKLVARGIINLKIIIIFFILFNLTLLLIWPIGSADVFSYISQSRVFSAHHANPFVAPYSSFTNDAFYPILNNGWSASLPTPYGPLFVIIGSAITKIGNQSFLLSLFLFKLFFILINLINCLLIYKIFNSKLAIFLYAWNPLIIFEFTVNAHNDVLIILFLLLGLLFLFKKVGIFHYSLAWIFLLLSVFVKYTAAIFLPIIFLVALFLLRNKLEKLYFVTISFFTTILISVILFWPFWAGKETFARLLSQITQSNQLLVSIIIFLLSYIFYNLRLNNYFYWAYTASRILFVAFYGLLIIKLIKNRKFVTKNDIIIYSMLAFIFFIATFFNWLMPWYLTPLIVLLIAGVALLKKSLYVYLVQGVTLYGILFYVFLR